MKTAEEWDAIWMEKVKDLIEFEATKEEIDAAALDHIRAIQADARQSAAREAAEVIENTMLTGSPYGNKLVMKSAILAHFNLEDGK